MSLALRCGESLDSAHANVGAFVCWGSHLTHHAMEGLTDASNSKHAGRGRKRPHRGRRLRRGGEKARARDAARAAEGRECALACSDVLPRETLRVSTGKLDGVSPRGDPAGRPGGPGGASPHGDPSGAPADDVLSIILGAEPDESVRTDSCVPVAR